MRLCLLLVLIACKPNKDDVRDDSDSADDTAVAYDCGTLPDRPPASSEWQNTDTFAAGGYSSIVYPPGTTGPIYAGTLSIAAFSSQDHGESWAKLRTETTHTSADLALDPDDPLTVWRSDGGRLRVSHDGGQSFGDALFGGDDGTGQFSSAWALGVAPWDGDVVYIVDNFGGTYRSDDAGASFVPQQDLIVLLDNRTANPYAANPWRLQPGPTEADPIVFSDSATLSTSTDGMASWQTRFSAPHGARAVLRNPLDAQHMLVGAVDGVYQTNDGGDRWTQDRTVLDAHIGAWSDDGAWLAFASETTLWVSDDAGVSYRSSPLSFLPSSGMAIVGDRLLIGGDEGMWISDDQGASFRQVTSGLDDFGMSVVTTHPVCPNRLMAATRCGGGVYSSDDYGQTWHHDPEYFHYVMNVFYDPTAPDTVYGVSDDRVLKSLDGGASWDELLRAYHFHAFGIDPQDPNRLLLGSVGSGLWNDTAMKVYVSPDGGQTWEDSSAGLPEASEASAHNLMFWPGDPEVVVLATYLGGDVSHTNGQGEGVFISTDRGVSWQVSSLAARDIAWVTDTDEGVAVATEDGVWHSEDKGATWAQYPGLTGQILAVDFAGDLALAVSFGGDVWRSDDHGQSWLMYDLSEVQDSTLAMVSIDATQSFAYATLYDKGVYRLQLD